MKSKEGLRSITIPNYPNYVLFEDGDVMNRATGRFRTLQFDKDGYVVVMIQGKTYKIHRLLAIAFIPNPLQLPQVNHEDGDKGNYELVNLKWCTNKENCEHASRVGLLKNKKLVVRTDSEGNEKEYESIASAAKHFKNITSAKRNISSCCRGIRGQIKAYGFSWRFKEVV